MSPAHTDASPASTCVSWLKIDANRPSSLAAAAEATATTGDHGPGAAGACDLPPRLRPAHPEVEGLPRGAAFPARPRGREGPGVGPGGRARCALLGSLPPPSAPGCLGWQGLGDSHEPVRTATAGGGGGQTRAPGSRQMGVQNAEGCIPGQTRASPPPQEKHSPLEGLPTPAPSRFPSPFSIPQAAEPASKKGCFGIK